MSFPVQNIRDAAKAKGLTLKSIEQALNIGNGVIAKWAKNRSYPPYDRIVAIADFLDVPVSQLTGDGEEAKKPTVKDDELSEYDMEIMELLRLVPEERKPNVTAILKEHLRLSGLIE